MTRLERVARSICIASGLDPDKPTFSQICPGERLWNLFEDQAQAVIDALEQWQPMDTAPNDTEVLVYRPDGIQKRDVIMKFDAPPERIWLQLHGDCEPEYPIECGEETTWCWESIFPQDIEYVRADIAEQMVKAARDECMNICKRIKESMWDSDKGEGAEACESAIRETIK